MRLRVETKITIIYTPSAEHMIATINSLDDNQLPTQTHAISSYWRTLEDYYQNTRIFLYKIYFSFSYSEKMNPTE